MTDSAASGKTYTLPMTRQRLYKEPPALQVPDIDKDAAERKRVLNVLAQRRYRERRRESRKKSQLKRGAPKGNGDAPTTTDAGNLSLDDHALSIGSGDCGLTLPDIGLDDLNLDLGSGLRNGWPSDGTQPTMVSSMVNASISAMQDFLDGSNPSSSINYSTTTIGADASFLVASGPAESFDNSSWLASSSSPSSLFTLSPLSYSTSSSSSSPSSAVTDPPPGRVPSAFEAAVCDFPDSYLLPVNDLTLLRAMMRIAGRLGCDTGLWSPTANSPFNLGGGTSPDLLPEHWRPTPTQLLLPHHPVMDFFPWPGVRDRVISVFSLPAEARPRVASSASADDALSLVNFVYDMEDSAEGLRVWGPDPHDPAGWEVGQVFFERWYFIFDRAVVEQSNRWRRARGAPPLAMHGASAGPRVEEVA